MGYDTDDPEISAMAQISRALTPLEPDALRRVLKWAIERFEPMSRTITVTASDSMTTVGNTTTIVDMSALVNESSKPLPRTFLNIADLFDAAHAESGLDKLLAVAYWFQVIQQSDDWESMSVNAELKDLGYPSSNITRDLDALMAKQPQLVMQVRKQGTTRQARKRYKLTREGIKLVEAMLSRPAPGAG